MTEQLLFPSIYKGHHYPQNSTERKHKKEGKPKALVTDLMDSLEKTVFLQELNFW